MTEQESLTTTNVSNNNNSVLSNVDAVRAPVVVSSNSSLDTSMTSTGSLTTRRLDIDNTVTVKQEESSSTMNNGILQLPPIQSTTPNQLWKKISLPQYHLHNNNTNTPAPCPIPNTIPSIHYPSTLTNHNNNNIKITTPKPLTSTTQHPKPLIRKSNATSSSHNNTVPEFLYQLTKLLTDDNRHVIEWSKGKSNIPTKIMTSHHF